MENRRANLRIPRRALSQWERVKAKLTTRIVARGQEADGPTIFCEACGLLDAVLGGSGIIAEPAAPARPNFEALLGPYDPAQKAADQADLAQVLRKIADRLETGDAASE